MKRVMAIGVMATGLLAAACQSTQPPDLQATEAALELAVMLTVQAQLQTETLEPPLPTPEPLVEVTVISESTPTIEGEPTASPVERTRVIAFDGSNTGFTKLEGLAFANGIEFTRFDSKQRDGFLDELKISDVAVGIYSNRDGTRLESDLLVMADFLEDGGRSIL